MKNLRAARKKELIMYKGSPIRLKADSSSETRELESSGTSYSKCWGKKKKKKNSLSNKTILQKQRIT